MIKNLNLSYWIYKLSLVALVVNLVGLTSQIINQPYPILFIPFLITMYFGIYIAPIAIILLIVDSILNRHVGKYQYISFLINLFILITVFYLGYHAMNNFLHIG